MKRLPPDYFERVSITKIYDEIENYFKKQQEQDTQLRKEQIHLYDDFSFQNIIEKNLKGGYFKNGKFQLFELYKDFRKLFAIVANTGEDICFMKSTDASLCPSLIRLSRNQLMSKLKDISIMTDFDPKTKEVTMTTLIDIFRWENNPYKNSLIYSGYQFRSPVSAIFSVFRGFPYKFLKQANGLILQPFLEHVLNVICDGNEDCQVFLLQWLAYIVQNPGWKNISAVLILGKQGTGKNTFTNILASIFGCYCNPNSTMDTVVGRFNDSIRDKMLIIVNEVSGKDYNKSNKFKTYITEGQVEVEQKFRPKMSTENNANFILLSNEKVPIHIPSDDRRFFVVESKSPFPKEGLNKEQLEITIRDERRYFENLRNLATNKEFCENLLTFFKNFNLRGFNSTEYPITEAKIYMIEQCDRSSSSSSNISQATEFEMNSFVNFKKKDYKKRKFIPKKETFEEYNKWAEENGKPMIKNFGTFCSKMLKVNGMSAKRPGSGNSRHRYFEYEYDDNDDNDTEEVQQVEEEEEEVEIRPKRQTTAEKYGISDWTEDQLFEDSSGNYYYSETYDDD